MRGTLITLLVVLLALVLPTPILIAVVTVLFGRDIASRIGKNTQRDRLQRHSTNPQHTHLQEVEKKNAQDAERV
jgi:hypothetical protein